jgi:hypothetical protein
MGLFLPFKPVGRTEDKNDFFGTDNSLAQNLLASSSSFSGIFSLSLIFFSFIFNFLRKSTKRHIILGSELTISTLLRFHP